jgi:hypothetical protein
MNPTETPKSSDETLSQVIARSALTPQPETPEGVILRKLRAHLAKGAIASAQRLARTLKSTFTYPSAMIAVAEAQHQASQMEAARRTLVSAQRRIQHFYEGDHWNGYPRAYYLLEVVQAQLALGDAIGAAQTAQTITTPDYRARALQATGQV